MTINFCWFRSQAASGAAGRANVGLCPAYGYFQYVDFQFHIPTRADGVHDDCVAT